MKNCLPAAQKNKNPYLQAMTAQTNSLHPIRNNNKNFSGLPDGGPFFSEERGNFGMAIIAESKPIGLYIHLPFCAAKCPYCDFYSLPANEKTLEIYTNALCSRLEKQGRAFDSIYFGGGSPSLLGEKRLIQILKSVNIFPGAEISVECNPSQAGAAGGHFSFEALAGAGFNRVSLGLQSAIESERKALGRRGSPEDTKRAVERAQNAGISNISLDLMLGIPEQTQSSLIESIEFCASLGAKHISAYILKIEEGTPFFDSRNNLSIPGEEETCTLYETACSELEKLGFLQYEISNFALPGFESRHNLKYWNCEEYLGIGSSAHSFVNGKRFYYPRSIESFIAGTEPVDDGEGGSFEEYAMLRLRLRSGLVGSETVARFGFDIPEKMRKKISPFVEKGLAESDEKGIRLNTKGFLISSYIIVQIL